MCCVITEWDKSCVCFLFRDSLCLSPHLQVGNKRLKFRWVVTRVYLNSKKISTTHTHTHTHTHTLAGTFSSHWMKLQSLSHYWGNNQIICKCNKVELAFNLKMYKLAEGKRKCHPLTAVLLKWPILFPLTSLQISRECDAINGPILQSAVRGRFRLTASGSVHLFYTFAPRTSRRHLLWKSTVKDKSCRTTTSPKKKTAPQEKCVTMAISWMCGMDQVVQERYSTLVARPISCKLQVPLIIDRMLGQHRLLAALLRMKVIECILHGYRWWNYFRLQMLRLLLKMNRTCN